MLANANAFGKIESAYYRRKLKAEKKQNLKRYRSKEKRLGKANKRTGDNTLHVSTSLLHFLQLLTTEE